MHREPPTQTHRILLQQQETIINDEASGPGRRHTSAVDGGSVQKQKVLLCLGKWLHLCRLEGQQGLTGRCVGACWAAPPLDPADGCLQVLKGCAVRTDDLEVSVWCLSSLSHVCAAQMIWGVHTFSPPQPRRHACFQWRKGSETQRRKLWSLTASGKRWVGVWKRAIGASPSVSGPSQDSPL